MSKADAHAGKAIAYAIKGGELVRAQSSAAQSFSELLSLTRQHFGVERALALVPSVDRLPKP